MSVRASAASRASAQADDAWLQGRDRSSQSGPERAEGSRHASNIRTLSGSLLKFVIHALREASPFYHRRVEEEFEDDSSSEEGEGEEDHELHLRKHAQVESVSPGEKAAMRALVMDALGARDLEPRRWIRLQRCVGVLELRIRIGVKRLMMTRETPAYPAVHALVSQLRFEMVIGVLILLNAINIGADSMYREGEVKPSLVVVLEHIFITIFVVEFFLRIMANSWVWLFEPVNIFDTFVVWVTGVLVTWILVPAGVDADVLQRLAALRILRLTRVIRAIRVMPVFRELWMLVDGIVSSFNLLLWASVIIVVVHYMFAVFAIETIAKSDTFANDAFVQEHFGGLGDAMFSLFQIMTFDSWGSIVRYITHQMPEAVVLFQVFMGVSGIVLFNLMTAIVVMNALVEGPKKDEEAVARLKELEILKTQQQLREMFDEIDEDGSGRLSREEFSDVLDDVSFLRTIRILDIDPEELPDIFDILDDGEGEISIEGFCTGLMRMQGAAMARDLLKSTKRMTVVSTGFSAIDQKLNGLSTTSFDRMEQDLDISHENFTEMQILVAKVLAELDGIGTRRIARSTLGELPPVQHVTMAQAEKADRASSKNRRGSVAAAATRPASKAADDGHLKALPNTWILRRREERKRRPVRAVPQSWQAAQKEQEPGVMREFQGTWTSYGLSVPLPGLSAEAGGPRAAAEAAEAAEAAQPKGRGGKRAPPARQPPPRPRQPPELPAGLPSSLVQPAPPGRWAAAPPAERPPTVTLETEEPQAQPLPGAPLATAS